MINANDSQIILEKCYANCVNYWKSQSEIDEREAYKRALEHDLIDMFKANGGYLHNPFTPKGDELDKQTTIDFLKYRCQDLYGKEWEKHWEEYNIV